MSVAYDLQEYFLTVYPYNREPDFFKKKFILFGSIREKAATHRSPILQSLLCEFIDRERYHYEKTNTG